ncbi:MAG: peptidase M28 [Cytophaga sp.]|nr:peptidase M28 [Cytophaga sp.]
MSSFTRFTFVSVLLHCLVLHAFAQDKKLNDQVLSPLLSSADKAQIRQRIMYLSGDQLKGRLPGTEGYRMAVDFVINELKALGVKPKGDQGFIQHVTLRKGVIDSAKSSMSVNGIALRYGKEYALAPDLNKPSSSAEAEVVYAGYGIVAPHLQHDDYQAIDVKGKIVVISDGVPQDFPASERAHFNLAVTKCEAASKRGAAGVVILLSGNETLRMGGITKSGMDGITGYVTPDGRAFSSRTNVFNTISFLAYSKASLFEEWIQDKKPRALNLKIKVQSATAISDSKSENIVGVIEGTDAQLKEEYVVHTAHLDHVGIGTPVKGDSIYNGAHDNASGVACLIEIAKLYTKAKLKRSVLMVLVTSEEKGLLGSGYFASHPTVPKDKIVADINTDMPTLIAPLLSIEPLGAVHSSLMNEVKKAADYLHLDVMEDHMPEQVRFVRSDQYSFIRQGIPALHVKYGLKTDDPAIDLRKKIDEWTEAHYHKPSDEFADAAFNFDAAVTYVKLNFLIGWQVANTLKRPAWNKGDFFGDTFGKK